MLRFVTAAVAASSLAFHIGSFDPARTLERPKKHACTRRKTFDPNCKELIIFAGNAHKSLGLAVAGELGKSLGKASIGRFSDGEVSVKIEESVRGKDVYVVQPTCPPVNENLIELLLITSALRRASAKRVTVLVPYFGYMRSGYKASEVNRNRLVSRKSQVMSDDFNPLLRESIVPMFAASDVARMLEVSGVHRVVVVDLQAPGLGVAEGFFQSARVETMRTGEVIADRVLEVLDLDNDQKMNLMIVAPHSAAVPQAKKFRDRAVAILGESIGLGSLISNQKGQELVGSVDGKTVLMVEDIIDTGKTTCVAVQELYRKGAKEVFVYATHALLSGRAAERLNTCGASKIVVLDTVPLETEKVEACPSLQQVSIAPALADLIKRMHYSKKE